MTRSRDEFETVMALIAEGHNDCEVARLTDIPRPTVRGWRRGEGANARRYPEPPMSAGRCVGHDFSAIPLMAYVYLLGMYLGDGYIAAHHRGVWRLRIFSDVRYPRIIDECSQAMEAVMPGQRAHRLRLPSACIEISMYSKHWPCFFPQHGPGRKHKRLIRLEPWQEEFVNRETESFLRGLIHSDGCRVVANDRGVKSVRYHFSNRSEDIKGIFCAALDRLEIPWTRPSDRDIAIYRKAATARLDEFIGPKG